MLLNLSVALHCAGKYPTSKNCVERMNEYNSFSLIDAKRRSLFFWFLLTTGLEGLSDLQLRGHVTSIQTLSLHFLSCLVHGIQLIFSISDQSLKVACVGLPL